MISNPFYQKLVLSGLLGIHLVWLVLHLTFGYLGHVNAWKLGGYGMYTAPKPSSEVRIFVEEEPALWVDTYEFENKNWSFNWHCKKVSESSLQTLLSQNQELVGKDFNIIVNTERFTRYPVLLEREEVSNLEILWEDNNTQFHYQGLACGSLEYEGTGVYISRN